MNNTLTLDNQTGTRLQEPVKNIEEVQQRLAELPEFSQQVYATIKAGLYAEPFFSDLRSIDVAKKMNVKPVAVNAALGHLIAAGLVYTEEFVSVVEFFERRSNFIHSYEHDDFERI